MTTPATVNLSKLGTDTLRKKIEEGKFTGDTLKEAKVLLKSRDDKAATGSGKTVAIVTDKVKTDKPAKSTEKKVRAAKEAYGKPGSRRAYLVEILTPTDGSTIAAVNYTEAKKLVGDKFPNEKRGQSVYSSEFGDAFKYLQGKGILTEHKSRQYKDALSQ